MQLSILPTRLSICRLAVDHRMPTWLPERGFLSYTRTADELSIVCEEACVPAGVQSQGDWRCIKVQGPIDFSQCGILASLAVPLAESGISIFAISTFDTDYVLIEEKNLARAATVLTAAGHKIQQE